MKTLFRLVLAMQAMLIAPSAIAQGLVHFQNYDPQAGIDAPLWAAYPFTKLDGANPNMRAALFGGPEHGSVFPIPGVRYGNMQVLSSSTSGSSWVRFQSGSMAGYFDVGQDEGRVVPGVKAGENAMITIVYWNGPWTTWDEVWAATKDDANGKAASFALPSVKLASDLSDLTAGRLFGMPPFLDLVVVPEPSSATLLALAAVCVWLGRASRR